MWLPGGGRQLTVMQHDRALAHSRGYESTSLVSPVRLMLSRLSCSSMMLTTQAHAPGVSPWLLQSFTTPVSNSIVSPISRSTCTAVAFESGKPAEAKNAAEKVIKDLVGFFINLSCPLRELTNSPARAGDRCFEVGAKYD